MMTIKDAIRMAQMFAEVAADAAGVACMCMLGPCPEGVRWIVVTETGAHVAAGEVAVSVDEMAREDLTSIGEVKKIAQGRN